MRVLPCHVNRWIPGVASSTESHERARVLTSWSVVLQAWLLCPVDCTKGSRGVHTGVQVRKCTQGRGVPMSRYNIDVQCFEVQLSGFDSSICTRPMDPQRSIVHDHGTSVVRRWKFDVLFFYRNPHSLIRWRLTWYNGSLAKFQSMV